MKKRIGNNGFSLVELIIVIAIMAILIGALAPQYIKYVEKSRVSADMNAMDIIRKNATTMASDEQYCESIDVDDKITVSKTGTSENGCAGIAAALDEYIGDGWRKTHLTSKKYNTSTYVVQFVMNSNSDLNIITYWE